MTTADTIELMILTALFLAFAATMACAERAFSPHPIARLAASQSISRKRRLS